jgi:hypothetical protein
MNDDFLSRYVLEWSHSQQNFHWQTVNEMLETNWNSFLHREPYDPDSDWLVVGFGDTPEDLDALRERLEKMLDSPHLGDSEISE